MLFSLEELLKMKKELQEMVKNDDFPEYCKEYCKEDIKRIFKLQIEVIDEMILHYKV